MAYEPGNVDRGWLRERQEGRFTFEARAIAREISRRYESSLQKGDDPDLTEFHQWLMRADEFDDRITRLPERESGWRSVIESMILRGEARIHCRRCRTMIDPDAVVERKCLNRGSYAFDEIRCPSAHLLFRPFLIAVCRIHPAKFKEALKKSRAAE